MISESQITGVCSIRVSTLCLSRECSYEGSVTDSSLEGGDRICKFDSSSEIGSSKGPLQVSLNK